MGDLEQTKLQEMLERFERQRRELDCAIPIA